MQAITAHVFDVSTGMDAPGIAVRLERHAEGRWHPAGLALTDQSGRAHPVEPDGQSEPLVKGDYRLTFEVAAYFKAHKIRSPYPFVQVTFSVGALGQYHVALSLGPFGYSTVLQGPQ